MTSHWFSGSMQIPDRALPEGEKRFSEGMAHLQRGCCVEAVESLSRAAELKKDDVNVWNHLGLALVGIDQSRKARDCFERSLALAPGQPLVWNKLGVLLLHAGALDEAQAAFKQALALDPGMLAARQNAAVSLFGLDRDEEAESLLPASPDRFMLQGQGLKAKGDLMGATEVFRQAIRALRRIGFPRAVPQPGASTRERARKALLAAKALLDGAGIGFCLLAGTLLGVVRDGDLLAQDKDLDLGVAWDLDRSRVVETLCAGGAFTVPWFQGTLPPDRPWYRSFIHAESDFVLDVFFLKPEGDSILCGSDNRPGPILCRLKAFSLRDWSWMGLSWRVPDPPEHYLSQIYGPDWQVPDPHYDTILSNPTRTRESVPEVLCMSYFKLYEALAEGKAVRAKKLAAQLFLRTDDPFLAELQAQLEEPIRVAEAPGGGR